MAAFAAVVSLKRSISCVRFDGLSKEIIESAEEKLESFLEILERLDDTRKSKSRKKINALDERIKEAIWRFEDLVESHARDRILLQLEADPFISKDMQEHDIDSFMLEVESMKNHYIEELNNLPDEEEEEVERVGFDGKKSKMVGFSDQFQTAKSFFMKRHVKGHIYMLLGMAGIGKTTLAKELFDDPEIRGHFEHRVWVNGGRKSRTEEYYARAILSQVDPNDDKEDEREIVEYVKERLVGKKCLVVFDDVWESHELKLMMSSLPSDSDTRIVLLLTGRDRYAMGAINEGRNVCISNSIEVVRFMNEDESTNLLCKKVFGEEGILPSHLEKAAKKIAKNCEGLPLLIVAVADRLSSEGDMTEEYWNAVAEKRNSVFADALDEISKVLFPSYNYLPQRLKMFFLYLGVFPPDCDISRSKLANYLASEGWIYLMDRKYFPESKILDYLDVLCFRYYLVLYNKKSRLWHPRRNCNAVKTCRLHCSWRHLCQVEARKIKFYQVLNRWVDASEEVIKGQRCLSFHNNVLFAIKDVHDSVARNCASSTRSLHCFGPYHQYPVPVYAGFKFLRELNALNLRFYTFPTEILQLVLLKYLALTCNGEIPPAISKLVKLEALIIHPHTNIKIRGAPSYIPIQIWDMQELDHIEILGRSLRSPYHVDSFGSTVRTLLGVNASITTLLKVCDKFREIRKLGIHIELTPYDDDIDLLNCFHFISKLSKMEALKCSIVNPHLNHQFLAPPTCNSFNFSNAPLRKLYLSGMGFPWEFIDVFGLLPYLEVLKLRCYAFRGPKWDMKENSFKSLEFLLIEDSDLEQWTPGPACFPCLTYLSMKHCYKLQKLNWGYVSSFGHIKIELADCNPLATTCGKQIELPRGCVLNLTVTSSYGGHHESRKIAGWRARRT